MQRIVINISIPLWLSDAGIISYADKARLKLCLKKRPLDVPEWRYQSGELFHDDRIPRDDKHLVKVFEEMGNEACEGGIIKIVEIPDGVNWHIEFDGYGGEIVVENYRTWG